MVKIRLHREPAEDASDERDPYILTVSRVPCVGEKVHAVGSDAPVRRKPGLYTVTDVIHYAGFGDEVAARIYAREEEP